MSVFEDQLSNDIKTLFVPWDVREGRKVPEHNQIALGNEGVKIEATILYADMANSTGLARDYNAWFAAAVSKAFLLSAVRIIRNNRGEIASFDGDRVMAIFFGDSQNSDAAIAALQINYAVSQIIKPFIKEKYPNVDYVPRHCVGIDRSPVTAVRAGIRGNNDLIWIGRAANYAAILSEIRTGPATYITQNVFTNLNNKAKYRVGQSDDMWTKTSVSFKGQPVECYHSNYRMSF